MRTEPIHPSCTRCHAQIEAGDLRCAVCGLAVPVESRAPATNRITLVRCDSCGAAVRYSAEKAAPVCAFCASAVHVETIEDPPEAAESVLPFRISPQAARGALQRWFKTRGFFCPSDLATEATVDSLRPLWWAAWVVNAEAEVHWTADSNAGSGPSDWAPHSGATTLRFDNIFVRASRGLREHESAALSGHFDLRTAGEIWSGPEGALVESFETQRSTARKIVLQTIGKSATDRLTHEGHVPGSLFRKVQAKVLLKGLTTRRLACPSYVFAYRYRGSLYRSVVHGQNAAIVLGDTPVSFAKVALVMFAMAVAAAGVTLGLIFLLAR